MGKPEDTKFEESKVKVEQPEDTKVEELKGKVEKPEDTKIEESKGKVEKPEDTKFEESKGKVKKLEDTKVEEEVKVAPESEGITAPQDCQESDFAHEDPDKYWDQYVNSKIMDIGIEKGQP